MAKILIIGAGAMGSAFAFPCIDNNNEVTILGTHLEDDFIEKLKKTNNYHPALDINLENKIKVLKFQELRSSIILESDLIVVGVSSKGIEWIGGQITKYFKGKKIPKILLLTKGLSVHNNKYELLVDKLKRILTDQGLSNFDISAVGGPCLAKGLSNRVHSSVVVANEEIKSAKIISSLIATNYYHVEVSSDVVGVEVSAAIKNIYSMAVGAAKGLCNNKLTEEKKEQNYLNTASALFNQSIKEMEIFISHLKGQKDTVTSLAGLGDLYVSSGGGRNSKMGSYLGEGLIYSEAKKNKMLKITVEGAELIKEIGTKVKEEFSIDKLPIMMAMIDAILDDKKLSINWEKF
jgi:glycerol-3-phosphate dehydrogenase (NAD(P)+)